jgi:hypothetical protein
MSQKLIDRARKAYSRFDSAKAFWKVPRKRGAALRQAPLARNTIANVQAPVVK